MLNLDRLLRFAGVIALLGIFFVFLTGTLRDDDQDRATRDVACAVAEWDGDIVVYFQGAVDRVKARIGTPEEVSTDRDSVAGLQQLLDAATNLARDIEGPCGDVIPRRS